MDTATATAFPVFVKTEPIEDLLAAAFSSQESASRSSVDSYPSSDDSSPRQGGGVASTDRRRELNRCAAKRYRERKRLEQLKRLEEFTGLELRNKELRGRVQSLEQEIRLLVSCLPGEFRLQLSKSEDSLKICKVEPLDDLASTSSLPVSSSQLSALAAFCLPLLMRTGVATQE